MTNRTRALATAALVAAVLAIYLPALGHEWVNWDDAWLIRDNPLLLRFEPATVSKILFDLSRETRMTLGAEYLPVRDLVTMLGLELWGRDAAGWLAANVLLYAAAVLLFFCFVERLHGDATVALLAALAFAVHPLHVESVAWASSLKDVLGLVLFMAALVAFERHLERGRRIDLALSCAAFLLALGGKYVTLVLPGFLVLRLALARHLVPQRCVSWRRGVALVAPFAALAAGYLAIVVEVGSRTGVIQQRLTDSAWINALTVLDVWATYLGRVFLPVGLSPDYLVTAVGGTFSGRGLRGLGLGIASLVLLGMLVLRLRRPTREPDEPAAVNLLWTAWFFVALVPFADLVPIENKMADRYLLLPLMGPAALAAWWVGRAWRRFSRQRAWIAALSVAAVLGLGILAARQVSYWSDSLALWQRAVAMQPVSPRALYQLAVSLEDLERYDEEAVALERLLAIDPHHPGGLNNLGINRFRRGGDRGEIVRLYEALLRRNPTETEAMNNLAVVLIAERRYDEARAWLERSLSLRPDYCGAMLNLGRAWFHAGDPRGARAWFERALACNPAIGGARDYLRRLAAGEEDRIVN